MKVFFNIHEDDKPYQGMLKAIIKQHDISGAASLKTYDLTALQKTAADNHCQAVFVTNPDTLKSILDRPKATLDAYRGSRLNFDIPVFIGNPMDHLTKVSHGRWLFDRDLEKVKQFNIPPNSFQWKRAENATDRAALLREMSEALLIAFDIETKPSIRLITCISFSGLMADGKIKTWVIPFVDFTEIHYHSDHDLGMAIQCMRDVLSLPIPKVAQNGIYDCTYCLAAQAPPINYLYDTMMMAWSRYSELPKSLDFLASIYLHDYVQWKQESEEASDRKDIMSYWAYCAKDSWSTLRIAIQQMMISSPTSYWMHNYKRTFRLSYPAIYMAFEGCLLDLE
jgi:hypothetical protein